MTLGCGGLPGDDSLRPPEQEVSTTATSAPASPDTGLWIDTGSCEPVLRTCDVDCDGVVDAGWVLVTRPTGETLPFEDLAAALAFGGNGATVTLCPGVHTANVRIDADVTLEAFGAQGGDSGGSGGTTSVSVLEPGAPGAVITVAAGRSVTLSGLAVRGCALAPSTSSGPGGSGGATGGSGAGSLGGSGGPGGSGGLPAPGAAPCPVASTGIEIEPLAAVSMQRTAVWNHRAGGIRAVDASSLDIADSFVARNSGEQGAGLFASGVGRVSLTRSLVSGNDASAYAGGVYVEAAGALDLDFAAVVNNRASGDGGGLHLARCASPVGFGSLGLAFNRSVAGGGGALFLDDCAVDASGPWSIVANAAEHGGGVAIVGGSAITGARPTVSGNDATWGGGIYVRLPPELPLALDLDLRENAAGFGGGAFIDDGHVILSGEIRQNAADAGGGVYVAGGHAEITGAMTQNTALLKLGGAAAVDKEGRLSADGADLGVDGTDNDPADVLPLAGGAHSAFGAGACFACTAASCEPCP